MSFPSLSFPWAFVILVLIAIIFSLSGLSKKYGNVQTTMGSIMFLWALISLIVWLVNPETNFWVISNNVGVGAKPKGWPFFLPGRGKSYWGYNSSDLILSQRS